MTKNPFINAFAALAYIVLIVSTIFYGSKYSPGPDNKFLIPIAMLSLFTLSAGVMGYVFVSQPLLMYIDGHKKEAVSLFVKTLGTFAVITIIALALVFFRVFS